MLMSLNDGRYLPGGLKVQRVELVEETVVFHAHAVRAASRAQNAIDRPAGCTGTTDAG